jgi:tight adherence protein B
MEWITLTVFLTVLVAGLVALTAVRKSHTSQVERLLKYQRKLSGEAGQSDKNVFLSAHGVKNPKLARMLVLAGLDDNFPLVRLQWIITTVVAAILGAGVAVALSKPVSEVTLGFFLGLLLGAAGYLVYLKKTGEARQQKLTRQLPQVLDSMSATLKAGSSIMDVFRSTSEMAPEPIRGEFYKARGQVKLNKSLIEVIREMSERITTRDFKFFVQAVSISEQTGADLADAVASIAETLRDRFRLRDMVDAMTSQGKMTALIVGVLPYLLAGFYMLTSPQYIEPLLANGTARLIICGLILWEGLGVYILWNIVSFEV